MNNQLNLTTNNSESRVVDYFLVAGLPTSLTRTSTSIQTAGTNEQTNEETLSSNISETNNHDKLLYPINFELESQNSKSTKDPIVELAIINKTLNESVPIGYECIWLTPANHSANLIHDTFIRSNEMFLCYKRGKDQPPITDIGVFYEGTHEKVLEGCIVIRETAGGQSANLNNSNFTAERIYVTYRRATEMACNSLAVIDICVIAKFKDELAPHTFNEIHKNLNRNLLGKSVHICYKKAWIPAPQIKYIPTVLFRYPQVDHQDLPFPNEVALFGLPMGAVIESWPVRTNSHKSSINKPVFSTFVLNVNSDDGIITEKVYGSCITFYEHFDSNKLTNQQKVLLNIDENNEIEVWPRSLHSNKCLIILSRHPLFQSFKEFLMFIYLKYSNLSKNFDKNNLIKIEQYLTYMIYEVPFPTSLRPRVLINLTEHEENCISISWPNESILPQSGASFIELLCNLGVDNSIQVFLFILLQRNVMFHSLRRTVLTGVVEAVSCIIFPFMWRYTYLPMCPLKLCDLIDAPGSFILGMDTRFFDMFDLPQNVLCVDLDTNTLSSITDRKFINLKIVPRKALSQLQSKLTSLLDEIDRFHILIQNESEKIKMTSQKFDLESKVKRQERLFDLAIREAFLKFMASILFNYKSFLKTNTRKPVQKAKDRNLAEFFDTEAFLRSKETSCQFFYKELVKTQLFYDCIMNLSFTSELDPVLADSFAFFAEICSKVNPSNQQVSDDIRLIDLNQHFNNQTIVILPPTVDTRLDSDAFIYDFNLHGFPKLKYEVYKGTSKTSSLIELNNDNSDIIITENGGNSLDTIQSTITTTNSTSAPDSQSIASSNATRKLQLNKMANTPIGVRTNAEKLQAQKKIENEITFKQTNNPKTNDKNKHLIAKKYAFHFLSNAYSLWFIYLPEYLKSCEENAKNGLNYAYQVLIQMQKHNLTKPDEICFRIMMQLCLLYKLPTLAVRIFLLMRRHKIELTPITYSYYNKAIIECWSSFEQDRWAKLRLIWHVVYRFKKLLLIKKERERQKKKKSGKTLKRKKILISNKKNTIIHNTSNLTSNVSSSQLIMKQTLSQQNFKQISNKVEKEIQTENDANDTFKKLKYEIRQTLKKSFTNKLNMSSVKLDQQDFNHNRCFYVNDIGLLFILSDKTIKTYLNENKMIKINSDLNLDKLSTLLKVTFVSPKRITNKKDSTNSILTPITITHNDPLSSFSHNQQQLNQKPDLDKVKKKLFDLVDYVPFSDSSTSLNQIKQSNSNSDFIFNNNNKKENISNLAENINKTKEIDFIYNQNYNYDYNNEEEDEEGDEYIEDDDVEYDSFSDEYDDSYYDTSYEEENEDKIQKNGSQTDNNSLRNKTSSNIIDIENASISSFNSKKGSTQLNNNNNNNNNNSNSSLNEHNNETYNTNNNNNNNNNFTSPITPFLGSRVISFMRKMENSLETSGSKIKVMSKMITEKTQNIKEIIISNTNQPESITSKLMSISSYNLSSPQQYINGLIKSNTNLNEFVSNNNNSVNHTRNNNLNNSNYDVKNLTPSDSISSQTSLDRDNFLNAYINSSDLDIIQNDDTFKPLSIKWWCLDKTDDYLNFFDFYDENGTNNNLAETDSLKKLNEALIDIQISSCNYCEKCDSFLYDEEIMSGWTLKDSDLNVKCFHCSSLLVPNLYIKIQDLDTIRKHVQKDMEDDDKEDNNTNLPCPPLIEHPFDQNHGRESSKSPRSSIYSSPKINKRLSQLKLNQNEFTVQYLSPLVVRKELENIIMHTEPNDDKENLIDSKFIDEHSVVFWNLIWYFKRIGVDYGQLAITLLNSRLKTLREKNNTKDELTNNFFKFKNYIPNHAVIKPYNQHPNVKIRCMWDNLRLQDKLNTHEVPLYFSWIISNQKLIQEQITQRLITSLRLSEIKSFRKSNSNRRSLATLFESITRNIKESNIKTPINSLLRERYRSKVNYSSIYREILYLVLVSLEREFIDIDAFDTEYREMYRALLKTDSQELKSSDRPPNNVAVWCRRLFSPLLL